MKEQRFRYVIHQEQDHEVFQALCDRLEAMYPRIKKTGVYRDMDADETTEYVLDGANITVRSDFWIDDVYILSDVPLPVEKFKVA